MRIYVPVTEEDREALAASPTPSRLPLGPGRPAWAVTPSARAERPGEDAEDLEYEALQDAVYADLTGIGGGSTTASATAQSRRHGVIAGDVPDHLLAEASQTGGAFGVKVETAAQMEVASVHVTEHSTEHILADDTDPALLWFDSSEVPAALAYLAERSA